MKAALYTRVSTDEQAQEGYSIESQKDRVIKFIESQGWELADLYIDEGYSAKNLDRPAMQRLIKDAGKNKFEVVVFYKLDRLVRSVSNLHDLLKLFEQKNIKINSVTEVFETTTAMGRFFITLVAAMAEWERETISERVIENMTKKANLGERNGGKAPFGYKLENGELVIDKKEARIVKEIFKMYLNGTGLRDITLFFNQLGMGNKGIKGISYLISNPIYAGKLRWNKHSKRDEIITEGTHPSIIDSETFDKVQKLKMNRHKEGKKATSIFNFSGVLKCGRCGYALSGWTKSDTKEKYYICIGRKNYRVCHLPMFSEASLIQTFLESFSTDNRNKFFSLLNVDPNSEHDQEDNTELLKQIENELSSIKTRKKNWLMALGNGTIDQEDYLEMTAEDIKREKIFKKQIEEFKINAPNAVNFDEILDYAKNLPELFEHATDYEKKSFIKELFSEIVVNIPKGFKSAPGRSAKPYIERAELNNE